MADAAYAGCDMTKSLSPVVLLAGCLVGGAYESCRQWWGHNRCSELLAMGRTYAEKR